jgi:hypothetical protein
MPVNGQRESRSSIPARVEIHQDPKNPYLITTKLPKWLYSFYVIVYNGNVMDVVKDLSTMIGPPSDETWICTPTIVDSAGYFHFQDPNQAMFFKLAFYPV